MGTASRPLGGSASDVFDYLTGKTDGCGISPAYYDGGNGHGEAWGRYADRLGVTELTREQFINLAEGRSIDGSRSMVQTNNGKHVAGVDVTFSAPKSASVLLIRSTDEARRAIDEAWRASVRVAFDRMERDARVVRRPVGKAKHGTKTQGSATERVPADLIAFIAHHHTARPTDETEARGAPPDPHLHSHAFVLSQAWVTDPVHPDGGKVKAVDDWGIKHQAEAREAHLQADFGRRLEDLGYGLRWFKDRKGYDRWEVESVPAQTIRHFSSNARRAEQLARDFERKKFRPPSDHELRDEMRKTRRTKDQGHEHSPAWSDLVQAAGAAGVPVPHIVPGQPIVRPPLDLRERRLRERLAGPLGPCRTDAVFDRESVARVVARCAVGLGFTLDELDDFTARYVDSELVAIRKGHHSPSFDLFTTKANLADEQTIARTLDEKATASLPAPSPEAVQRAVSRMAAEGVTLDDEQLALVEAACSNTGLVNVVGYAGTGKTTALRAVLYAYRDRRSTGRATADAIITIATAAMTAERNGRKLEANAAHSVEAFCQAVRKGRIRPTERTVILLDEAVMVDTYRMARLLEAAGPARVVNIGDPRQLQAISAAGWFADQVKRHGQVHLTHVHRQVNQADVNAFAALRDGDPATCLSSLDQRERLHISQTRSERLGRALDDYVAHRNAGRSADDVRLVLDGSNDEVDTANRLVQLDRLRRGELGGPGFEVRSATTERAWTLYAGDSIMFLSTTFTGERFIRNGTTGRIVALHGNIATLALDGERKPVDLPLEALADEQAVGLSYAVHAQKMQGNEAAVILALPGRYTTSLESGYSILTRCVDQAHVYLDHETHGDDPLEAIANAWRSPTPKRSATAWLEELDALNLETEPPEFVSGPQRRQKAAPAFGRGLVLR